MVRSREKGETLTREELYLDRGWKVPLLFKAATYITWLPLFVIAVILMTLSSILPLSIILWTLSRYEGSTPYPILDVMLLGAVISISYLIFCIGLLVFGPIMKWVIGIFSHQREGEYPYLHPVSGYWSIVNGIILFNRNICLEITRTTFLIVLFYRLMGMKIGRGTLINSTYLHDPDLITIGRNVTIGGDVMILGHVGERGVLKLKKVRLGDYVEIGQSSLVMPGSVIEKGSMVGAHSIVLKDTVIPPYEIWAGVPARKVGNLKKPRSSTRA
jgi:hypothetical protein